MKQGWGIYEYWGFCSTCGQITESNSPETEQCMWSNCNGKVKMNAYPESKFQDKEIT